MSNSFFPPQIGFVPKGTVATPQTSQLVLGNNGSNTWEAVGFGPNGRPDYLESFFINLAQGSSSNVIACFSLSATGIQAVVAAANNQSLAKTAALDFRLREVMVCDGGVTKNMMILASATYPTGTS